MKPLSFSSSLGSRPLGARSMGSLCEAQNAGSVEFGLSGAAERRVGVPWRWRRERRRAGGRRGGGRGGGGGGGGRAGGRPAVCSRGPAAARGAARWPHGGTGGAGI